MRGCLGFLLFAAALMALLAVLAVQLLLPAVVASAVRNSTIGRGQDLAVEVDTSLAGVLLHGRVDRIIVSGQGVTEPAATIGSLSVTLSDVGIGDRSFGSANGTLSDVTVEPGGSTSIHIATIALTGSGHALTTAAHLDPLAAAAAIRDRASAAGVTVDAMVLTQGSIDLTISGHQLTGTPVLEGGGLVLDFGGQLPSVTMISAPAGGQWQITAATVSSAGIDLEIAIELT